MDNRTEIAIRIAMEQLGYIALANPTAEQIAEVNALAKEIMTSDPESEQGKLLAEQIAKGEDSEYVDRYDYYGHYETTISPAFVDIIKLFGDNAEKLKPQYAKKGDKDRTKEIQDHIKVVEEEMYLAIHKILNDHKVPVAYYTELFTYIKTIVNRFETRVTDTITIEKDLLLSVIVGAKHPEYNNYAIEFATEAEINKASHDLLAEKGIDRKEYFGN